ncbi:MAG: DUF3794 domain-containing protein [Clostridia bacterium]|nr:DUF3794 domain-containing protein [Clostridia bacterium]
MNGYFNGVDYDDKALMKVYDSVKHTDVTEEFILPDYLPDVKRIIKVDARPKLDGKYVSSGKIDYEGDVVCHILFCDEGNHLKNVTFTASFSDGVEIACIEDECVANLIPEPESVICKMLNPRRVSIRLRVDTSVTVWCKRGFQPELTGDIGEVERAERNVDVMKLICSGESGLSVSADLEADGALPQISEVISCDVDMSFYECKGADGKVLCRGEMPITVFYSSNDGENEAYTVLFRKLPVAQVVLADDVDESYSCMARGAVDDVKVNVSENGFGERRIIELDITYRVYLNCVGSSKITVTKDMYAIGKTVKTETEKETFYRFSKLYSTSFGANLALTRQELNLNNAESILSLKAIPKISSVQLSSDKSRVTVSGNARTSAIFKGEDGLMTHEYDVPFKVDLEASGVGENFIYNYDIVCMGAKGRFDSENLYTELDMQLGLMLLETEEVEVLKKADFKEPEEITEQPQMRFYYPTENETLWEIGKQFGVSIEELEGKNDIINGKLPSVLFIPYTK